MIRVYLETKTSYITYKNVDKVQIFDDFISVCIEGTEYVFHCDDIITYEIRKDSKNYEI